MMMRNNFVRWLFLYSIFVQTGPKLYKISHLSSREKKKRKKNWLWTEIDVNWMEMECCRWTKSQWAHFVLSIAIRSTKSYRSCAHWKVSMPTFIYCFVFISDFILESNILHDTSKSIWRAIILYRCVHLPCNEYICYIWLFWKEENERKKLKHLKFPANVNCDLDGWKTSKTKKQK